MSLTLENYSAKCIVVRGDTETYKSELKDLGGKWAPNLKVGGAGWIFPMTKKEKVSHFIHTTNRKTPPRSSKTKKKSKRNVSSSKESKMENRVEKLYNSYLNLTKDEQIQFLSNLALYRLKSKDQPKSKPKNRKMKKKVISDIDSDSDIVDDSDEFTSSSESDSEDEDGQPLPNRRLLK